MPNHNHNRDHELAFDPSGPWASDAGTGHGVDDLAVRLSVLARDLQRGGDTGDTLTRVVASAVALIPGAAQGSISAVTGTQVASRAHSGDLARRVDALQTQTGQGPCLDAVRYQDTVRVPDMAAEHRWPMFAPRALAAGAGSMLAFELYVDADNLGALNLFAHHAGAFDEESEHVGQLFAAHAAIAFAGVRTQDQLTAAMATRDLIGQAKGILMERFKITSDQAFGLLTQVSSQASRKLRDVAEELVHSGHWASPGINRHRPHAPHPKPPTSPAPPVR